MKETASHSRSTEEIWQALQQRIWAFIRSRVRDQHTADDLLQETFLRVQKKIDTLADDQRLEGWIYQIARNIVTDHHRAGFRRPETELSEIRPEGESEDVAANRNEEISRWLAEVVASLPEQYREPIRLYEFDGLSQQEVADRLGVSLSGAKSRIQRGRVKLKEALMACCIFQTDRRGNVLDYEARERGEGGSCCDDGKMCG